MGKPEGFIQSYVLGRLQVLENQGIVYFARTNSFSGLVTRYNGSQGYVKNSKRGMPDIVFCMHGKYVGIELKSPKGRQSPEQKLAELHITKVGGIYAVIKTSEEFEEVLRKLC